MALDKLCLTIFESPDWEMLRELSEIKGPAPRNKLYKWFCDLGSCQMMWHPHKFSEYVNDKIAYVKVDLSPKHFSTFQDAVNQLQVLLYKSDRPIPLKRFVVSRVDVASDIENFPLDAVLARLFANKSRRDSMNYYKGTIYLGANPKIRIYDKTAEIKHRLSLKKDLTEWEQKVLDNSKQLTRFEVQIKRPDLTLEELSANPEGLVSYFDRIEFYDFEDDENIASAGGLQLLMRNTRREFRKKLDEFKTDALKQLLRENYFRGVREWFGLVQSEPIEQPPF